MIENRPVFTAPSKEDLVEPQRKTSILDGTDGIINKVVAARSSVDAVRTTQNYIPSHQRNIAAKSFSFTDNKNNTFQNSQQSQPDRSSIPSIPTTKETSTVPSAIVAPALNAKYSTYKQSLKNTLERYAMTTQQIERINEAIQTPPQKVEIRHRDYTTAEQEDKFYKIFDAFKTVRPSEKISVKGLLAMGAVDDAERRFLSEGGIEEVGKPQPLSKDRAFDLQDQILNKLIERMNVE